MVELKIVKVDQYNCYTLQDGKNEHLLTIEFYNMPKPQKGDVLILPEKWLDRKSPDFVGFMCFEPGDEKSPKGEVVGLHTKTKDYILKRIYG